MNLERCQLVVEGRADSLNGMFDFRTGKIIAVCDLFTGEVFRCFEEAKKLGCVFRSPDLILDGPGDELPIYSRVVGPASAKRIAEFKERLGRAFPHLPLSKGHWYWVIEE